MGELINITGQFSDSQIPQAIARDTETAAAIADHEAKIDPHPIYTTQAEGDQRYRRSDTTQYFQGGSSSNGPYASCWSSRTMAAGYYGIGTSPQFSFGLHVQAYPWTDGAYMAFHRPGSMIAFLGLDTDNQLKWGGGDVLPVPKKIWHEGLGTPVWQSPSDSRLKKRIRPIQSALSLLLEAKPVSFEYNNLAGTWNDSEYQRKKVHYGSRAEEFPISDLVSDKENKYLGLDYIEIIPFLVKGVQEISVLIEELRIKVEELRIKV